MTSAETTKLTTKKAVAFLSDRGFPITPFTLLQHCREGSGPPFLRWGNRCLYDPADLLEWAHNRGEIRAQRIEGSLATRPAGQSACNRQKKTGAVHHNRARLK